MEIRLVHDMKTPTRQLVIKTLSFLLVALSILWMLWLLRGSYADVISRSHEIDMKVLTLSFMGIATSIFIAFFAFLCLLDAATGRKNSWSVIARFYFVGQIMKYLPGRFVGVAYQVVHAADIAKPVEWISVNMAHILLNLIISSGVGITILSLFGKISGWIFFAWLFIPLLLLCLAHRLSCSKTFENVAGWRKTLVDAIRMMRVLFNMKTVLRFFGWIFASWLVYIMAWALFGVALGEELKVGIILCGAYTVAWTLGFLAIITPSGLGVREAAFSLLANDFGGDVVFLVAAISRIGLLLADLLLGLIFLCKGSLENE